MALSIFIAGDVVPNDRTISLFNELNSEYLFNDLIPIIKSCDVSIANLEAPIVDSHPTPIKKSGPNLYTNKETILTLKKSGFKVLTLANNHFRDQGDNGVWTTIKTCRDCDVKYVGGGENKVAARRILYLEIKNKVISIINACEHEFSIASDSCAGSNPIDCIAMYEDIRIAKLNSDFVIVILHGGIEHYQYPTPRMKKLFHHFVHLGAQAVVNHHQHCFSGYEFYNGAPIFYGLGNFCFDSINKRNEQWNKGFGVILDIADEIKVKIVPYIQCSNNPKIQLCSVDDFLKEVDYLNKVILDDSLLEQQYCEYILNNRMNVFLKMLPLNNRFFSALFRRGFLGRIFSNTTLLRFEDLFMCESHRDIILHLLSMEKK